MKKGFTLIEILISIAILLLLAGLTIGAFYTKFRTVTVDKDVENVIAYLDKARNQSLASVESSSYGVALQTNSALFFKGTSETPSSNILTRHFFSANVTASSSLSGGAVRVYFTRLTGEPSATGTIIFMSTNGSQYNKTIVIRSTGLAEVQ